MKIIFSTYFPDTSIRTNRIAVAIILVLSCAFLIYALAKPKYAWDATQYVGCIFDALYEESWEDLHDRTYSYLANAFPAEVFTQLTTSPPGIGTFRSIVANDPDSFRQTQPVYCYKIGFVGPASALTFLGVDPHWALRLLAAVPSAILFALSALWLTRKLSPSVAVPMVVIGTFAILFQTARYEYPDGLTALFLGLALMAFADGRKFFTVVMFLCAMIVRADAIVYFGAFLGFATFLSAPERRYRLFAQSIPLGLLALGLYAGIISVFSPPGYAAVFHHSFIAQTPYLQSLEATVTPGLYLEILIRQLSSLAVDGRKLFIMIPLALAGFFWSRKDSNLSPIGDIGALALCLFLLHYLIFPYFDPRYYAAPFLFMIAGGGGVVCVKLLRRFVKN